MTKGGPPAFGLGMGLTTPHRTNDVFYEMITREFF
jgi:hypothetical protein